MESYGLNSQSMQNGNRPSRRTLRKMSKEMEAVREDTNQQLADLLTDEQMET